jgi:hypothetical protein
LSASATEIHLDVLAFEVGLLAAVTSFGGDYHMNWNHPRGRRFSRVKRTRTKYK